MPEFDTYKGIERYARHPEDPAAILSFYWLMQRTKRQLTWRAVSHFGVDDMSTGYMMQLGCTETQGQAQTNVFDPDAITQLSKEDREAAYIAACKSVGLAVDPATLSRETNHN